MPSRKSSAIEPRPVPDVEPLLIAPLPPLPRRRRASVRQRPFDLSTLGALWAQPGLLAGVDEAGRGPLAGPVVAAAVILNPERPVHGLADSKLLSPLRREHLYALILDQALCVGVAQASAEEIDALNILQASLLAMQRAVAALRLQPHRVLIDGNRTPTLPMTVAALVKADAKVPAVSAASIVAKVHRDRLCADLHARWPVYGFDAHKGYPTAEHLRALAQHGPCPQHRASYAPVRACTAGLVGRLSSVGPDGPA